MTEDWVVAVAPGAVVAVTRTVGEPELLFEAERLQVAGAIDRRRQEYSAARLCARRALRQLGLAPRPILNGPLGDPEWPAGTVGSLTHSHGFAAAIVALRDKYGAVGIDTEPNLPLPERVSRRILTPHEAGQIADMASRDTTVAWDRLVFSAKEVVFKSWFPSTHIWMPLERIHIELGVDAATFRGIVSSDAVVDRDLGAWIERSTGRWATVGAMLITWMLVER